MGRIGAGRYVEATLPRAAARGHGRRRRAGWGALAIAGLVVGALATTRRVVVEGESMAPTLSPGDRLLLLRLPEPLRAGLVRPGTLVAARDPRLPWRLLVKRVGVVEGGRVTLVGDDPTRSTDSRAFGPIDVGDVLGVVLYRYARAARAGPPVA